MADIRKLVATAILGSDLTDNPLIETALDRIRAFAFSDRLGSLLWRLRYANDHRAFADAVLVLSHRMALPGEARSMREKVAGTAIMEWLDDICRTCQGRGRLVPKNAPVATHACTKCNGTGTGHHSDAKRARALGLSLAAARKWGPRVARAHDLISAADTATWLETAARLERAGLTVKKKRSKHTNHSDILGGEPVVKRAVVA